METPTISIKKAKLDKELKLSAEYTENTNEGDINHSVAGASAVHDDLRIKFKALVPHIADLCDQYTPDGELDTENIVCRGITITDGKNKGYILTGVRELSSGKSITLNTPLLNAETSEDKYEKIEELRTAIKEYAAYRAYTAYGRP